MKHVRLQWQGISTSLALTTRLEMLGSFFSEHTLGFDATFSLHQTQLASFSSSAPFLLLPLVQLRAVLDLAPPTEIVPRTELSIEMQLTVVEVAVLYNHALLTTALHIARSANRLVTYVARNNDAFTKLQVETDICMLSLFL